MVYVFSNSIYRAETWAMEHRLKRDQYRTIVKPEFISGFSFAPRDRIVVVGIVSQFMLNAIQAVRGAPPEAPEIEFYP